MSDDHAFLAAVRETPDDLALRLVYADWLEERGDERHELIRVEAAMRAVPIWSDEFQRLKPTRNRLRTTLPQEWLATMDYLPKHRPMFGTLPPTAAERWRLAEEFIDIWHGGLKPGDGYTESEVMTIEARLGIRLPGTFRDWHMRAGKRGDIWSRNERFLPLNLLQLQSGNLIIRRENQVYFRWHIRPEHMNQFDPPVYCGDSNGMVAEAVSSFMLLCLVFESQFGRIWAEVHPRPDGSQVLSSRFQKADLPARYWVDHDVEVWESGDMIVMFDTNEWGYANCRTEDAYEQLASEFGERIIRLD